MDQQIERAIQNNDHATLSSIFATISSPDKSWQSLSEGEKRTLAAHYVKTALSPQLRDSYLPSALQSSSGPSVIKKALGHLPPSVDDALDNALRHELFQHLVDKREYRDAAVILSQMRMEEYDQTSVYFMTPSERCDVYVKIAECYLMENETVEADSAVTRAGNVVESISDPDKHLGLILRYRSTYARVLDANRKFLQAAGRYYDLSVVGAQTDIIDENDLLIMLGKATTCAILAPSGAQRQRILALIYKDANLSKLETISQFSTHASVLTKMYKNQILLHDDDLLKFEKSLEEHQRALMSDGLNIFQRALIEHNMVAISDIYASIKFMELGRLLNLTPERAESVAAKMIVDGSLVNGSIDQVDGLLYFQDGVSATDAWDHAITGFCVQLNGITDIVKHVDR